MASMSRRSAIGLSVALTASGSAAATPTNHTDKVLLALCRHHHRLNARFDALYEQQSKAEDAGDMHRARRLAEAQHRMVPYLLDLRRQVASTLATTADGRCAKAQVALTTVLTRADGEPLEVEDAMLWSICRDVLGADHPACG